ncbi:YSIRK-type signal peptide-containing protein [Staphylococcus nepalensis]|uniref:YSIRK-targeted triacylglycerol lipase n=1 Tax=Staphylococcus nepalensis TaxID=214473 RepID=UPI001E5C5ED0|nr:YSIRK-type signal peptide-containing protein [Staphylococcus nepalensis]MCD8892510.1 YSIRK-type signal peptide-containing protein [Staphylococcus nepalensis]
MEPRKNKYSIRKFTFGASSILIGSLLLIGIDNSVQAAETNNQMSEIERQNDKDNIEGIKSSGATGDAQSHILVNEKNGLKNDEQTSSEHSLHNEKTNVELEDVGEGTLNKEAPEYNESDKTKTEPSNEVGPENNKNDKNKTKSSNEVDPEYNENDENKTEALDEAAPEYNENDKNKTKSSNEVDPEYNENDENKTEALDEAAPEYNENDKNKTEALDEAAPEYNENDKNKTEASDEVDLEYNESDKTKTEPSNEVGPENNKNDKNKTEASDEAAPEYNESDKIKTEPSNEVDLENNENDKNKVSAVDGSTMQSHVNQPVQFEDLKNNQIGSKERQSDKPKDEQDKNLTLLKKNAMATTNNQTEQQTYEKAEEQPTKKAKQSQYNNEDPIILVHGFNGFTDDIKPSVLPHYWGGDKLNIQQDLEQKGYNTYEASIGALSSNHDRAVELYYYIKGGTVDYGAAHAEKYGHDRYGKTYEGVYKDWQPGQKVHLVGHSMGGQTIRQMEEYLRNGNSEEIEYQKQHSGEISPLFQGNHDNMISSITTLATPHNGTHAADELGNEALIRQVAFDYTKLKGNKYSNVDFVLAQWGLQQKDDETYSQYVNRLKDSKLWTTNDNGFYDLTRAGATELNKKTSLNPNIVYKTYTGQSTRDGLFGRQKSDINMFLGMVLTGNVIGKAAEKDWRVNDGLVSTISALHPFNQNFVEASDNIKKGVWQVTPIMHGWDHADFVGQDNNDTKRSQAELSQLYEQIASDLVKNEALEA